MIDIAIGERIASYRKVKAHSQRTLAKAIGVTFQQVQSYENGSNRVAAGRLSQIACFFDVPVCDLCGGVSANPEIDDVVDLLATPGAMELLRAFSEIQNPEVRQSLVTIAEATARRGSSE